DLETLLPAHFQHYVANALEWIQDLEGQVNREELFGPDRLPVQPVLLYGDVIAPVATLAGRRARALGINGFEVRGLDELARSYRQIPRVRANNTALVTVFRNLADNSLKYRDRDRGEAWLSFRTEVVPERNRVIVHLTDGGIGIPAEDLPLVFEDGFR